MKMLQNLLTVLHHARINKQHLSHEDTIVLLKSVKSISAHKALVEKVIYLIFIAESKDHKIKNLSKRQTQIFVHIGLGFSSREIGDLLEISEATVSTHRKQMIKRLGLSGAGRLQFLATLHIQNKLYD
ncbi:MAG: LuxR C-terminal-related transcriptional regulator [Bacteroidota bacterium]